jgi:hypothetical protein
MAESASGSTASQVGLLVFEATVGHPARIRVKCLTAIVGLALADYPISVESAAM